MTEKKFLGYCFYCDAKVYSTEKSINITGTYICNQHSITKRVLQIEQDIINVKGLPIEGLKKK